VWRRFGLQVWVGCAAVTMRCCLYNVLSAVRAGSLQQVVAGCKGDISFLTGLRWKASFDRDYTVLQFRNFFAVVFGHRRGAFTTKAIGCALVFRKAIFSLKQVRTVSCPPAGVAGRGGLVRMVGGKSTLLRLCTTLPRPARPLRRGELHK